MDFDFLKTGFGSSKEMSEEMVSCVLANIRVYTEEAVTLASHYVVHCGRQVVTKTDILKALQAVAVKDKDFWDKESTQEKQVQYFAEYLTGTDEMSDLVDLSEEEHDLVEEVDESIQARLKETITAVFPHLRIAGLSANEAALKCIEITHEGFQCKSAFSLSKCPCRLCKSIVSVDEEWRLWTPSTPSGKILRSALENTMEKFQ